MTYNPKFDIDLRRGMVGEELLGTFVEELAGGTIEVKTDYRVTETGNVYVETWHYRKPDQSDKRKSGINISEAKFYAFASPTGEGFIAIKTEVLKQIIRDTRPREVRQPIASADTMASIGRVIPVTDILKRIGLYKIE